MEIFLREVGKRYGKVKVLQKHSSPPISYWTSQMHVWQSCPEPFAKERKVYQSPKQNLGLFFCSSIKNIMPRNVPLERQNSDLTALRKLCCWFFPERQERDIELNHVRDCVISVLTKCDLVVKIKLSEC